MNIRKFKEWLNINKKEYWDQQYEKMIDASEIRSERNSSRGELC
jgi:hypothetical protein